jgi:DNA topoisomerase III
LQPLGKCPNCGSRVFETEKDYLCERTQATERRCKFKTGKMVLGQPILPEQVRKLLETGKTDLMDKFVSKAGRNFSAWLVVDDSGKVSFEFPPREGEAAA